MELKKFSKKKKPSSRIQRHKDSKAQGLGHSKQKKRHQYWRAKAEQYSSIIDVRYRVYIIKSNSTFHYVDHGKKKLVKLIPTSKKRRKQHASIIVISYRVYIIKVIVPFFKWAKRKTLLSFTNKYKKKEAVLLYNNY